MVLFRPFDDVNLANLVWLVVGKQLREGHVIAGKGVDTIKDGPARDAVVTVGSEEVARAVRILRDEQIGPPPSDLTGDISPEVARACPRPLRRRTRGTRRASLRACPRRSSARPYGSWQDDPASCCGPLIPRCLW